MRLLQPFLLALLISPTIQAQEADADSTGLPGDNFSLQGALDLFKQAKDLESFELALNAEDQHVNNLDLDGDGQVDYIRVVDHRDGDAHAIVMQVAVSKDEAQDVAVIELEKNGRDSAAVQIRGAEDLYGPDVMVEPYTEDDAAAPTKGPAAPALVRVRVWVNVWAWPCVTWIYGPTYVAWASPWHWGFYPRWWRPWRPHPYRVFWGWQRPRVVVYRPVHVCRVARANVLYASRARYAPRIRTATAPVIQRRAALRTAPHQPVQRKEEIRRVPGNKVRGGGKARPAERAPRAKPARRMHR